MLSGGFTFDASRALEFSKVTAKVLRTSMFRATDAVTLLHVDATIQNIRESKSEPWFTPRDRALVRTVRRTRRRGRARIVLVTGGDPVFSASWGFGSPTGRALEAGGEYTQWVNEYQRRARGRGPAAAVKGHKRQRKETARHYLERSYAMAAPYAALPVERMLDHVLTHGTVPKMGDLTAGLRK